jgi:DNA-binding Lrp family transcriptional regulator
MSGSYDLLVIATGSDLRDVATFVSERLASIEGVLSTATHFMLRAYKDHGHIFSTPTEDSDKPAVSA